MATGAVIDWEELKTLVETNRIADLRRDEEVLKKYRAYKNKLSETGQSLFSHLIFTELKWGLPELLENIEDIDELPNKVDLTPKDPRLLGNEDDIKILVNDFPYHFEPNVTHLVVWTKVSIRSDPESELGDISPQTRAIIDRYVEKTFIQRLQIPKEKVIWFRNWTALQSVRSISHIHVVVKDLPAEGLKQIYRKSGVPVRFDDEDSDLSYDEYLN